MSPQMSDPPELPLHELGDVLYTERLEAVFGATRGNKGMRRTLSPPPQFCFFNLGSLA
jgi:hypothetical protein